MHIIFESVAMRCRLPKIIKIVRSVLDETTACHSWCVFLRRSVYCVHFV